MFLLKEKRLYLRNEEEKFEGTAYARQVVRDIRFSTDARDFGYIAENIPCQDACPVHTNIPGYIRCIFENRNGRSYELNRMVNILPGVLGRICSRPCEARCRHGESDLGEPVKICHLKRAAADHKHAGHRISENLFAPSGKTVAVVGSGPSGLGAAHDLAALGHKVALYESMPRPGGMLMYGIPEFRLPRDLLMLEISNILRLGVVLHTGVAAGRDISLKDLLKKYDAVVLATGTLSPNELGIPGESLPGVLSGLDFMMRVNQGETPAVGERVAVIGDGFTAMDCARTCMRFGANEVTVNIRKTEEFMPVDEHEIFEAKFEKVKIIGLVNSVRILGKDRVEGIVFERNRLEFSRTGAGRDAVPISNSEFEVPCDTVIAAIGQNPATDFNDVKFKLDGHRIFTKKGTHATSVKNLFAAGDCNTGASTVIASIAQGRRCAHEVDALFAGRRRKTMLVRFEPAEQTGRQRAWDFIPPVPMPAADRSARLADYRNEVEQGFTPEQAFEESKRCYLCYLKYEINVDRCIYCFACIDVAPRDCIKMIHDVAIKPSGAYGDFMQTRDWTDVRAIAIDNKRCIRCGKCYEVCPTQCIHIIKTELIEQDLEA